MGWIVRFWGDLGRIIFLISILFFSSCTEFNRKKPLVEKGVIDLRNWDFLNEVAVLDGDWEFYPHEFIDPIFSKQTSRPNLIFEPVPGLWTHTLGTGDGYASYRIKILLPEDLRSPLAFKVSEHGTAYSMFVNGRQVCSNGKVGTTKETSLPQQLPLISSLIEPERELEVIFHVSNFHYKDGGLWYSVLLGEEKLVRDIRERNLLLTLFLCGSILIMAVYHLTIYTLRKTDKSPLLFGLFCIVILFRLLSFNEKYLTHLFPEDSFDVTIKIEYFGYYLAVPIFTHFLYTLFPLEFSKRILYVIHFIALVFALMVFFTSTSFYTHTSIYYHLFTFSCIGYFMYVILNAIFKKRQGAILIFCGTLIIVAGTINDILHSMEIIHSRYIVPESLLGFIFAQSIILAVRFSNAFNEVEVLGESLWRLNLELEEKVIERTEQYKQQKEIAENASSVKDKFVSIVSHDLRAPLVGVSNLLELLNRKDIISQEEDRSKYLNMARDSILQCLKMVKELLDLSRIETGVVKVRFKTVSVRKFVDSILEDVSPQGIIKNISFQCRIPESDSIKLDPELFSQVIRNLITNAIKFSFVGGVVEIDAAKRDDNYCILIKDSGVGMSQEKIQFLFEAGKTTSSLGTAGEKGSGMGLFIVKYITEAHNGKVRFESKEGVGTCCTICLPITK